MRPCPSTYAAGFPPVAVCGIKHHTPVVPRDGCTQSEGNVSTVSPIITVLSGPSCSRRAMVVSTQSRSPQHDWFPRPFIPSIQANSAPRCSVRPGWHHRVSRMALSNRGARQSTDLITHLVSLIIYIYLSRVHLPLSCSAAQGETRRHCIRLKQQPCHGPEILSATMRRAPPSSLLCPSFSGSLCYALLPLLQKISRQTPGELQVLFMFCPTAGTTFCCRDNEGTVPGHPTIPSNPEQAAALSEHRASPSR